MCAGFLSAAAATSDKEKVPTLDVVSLALTVLISAKVCAGVTIDQGAFTRFLGEKGLTAADLTSRGPNGSKVVALRAKLRRRSQQHTAEFCHQAFGLFGPEGTISLGLLREP
jgi:hypothetical protein